MQESVPVGAADARPLEPTSDASRAPADGSLSDPRALQILSTEHWSLLASRSLAYNEAFSRAGMFLSFLSATLIVIGFLIGTQGLSAEVVPVATILLLADLAIGLMTIGRLIAASGEELHCVRGMNRIRHAYREMVPGVEPYFSTPFHDDARSVLAAYGDVTPSSWILANVVHGLTTTIGMIATINAMLIGALVAIVAMGFGVSIAAALLVGFVAFLIGVAALARIGMRTAFAQQERVTARFPAPPDDVG